jgi:hypothetical protein
MAKRSTTQQAAGTGVQTNRPVIRKAVAGAFTPGDTIAWANPDRRDVNRRKLLLRKKLEAGGRVTAEEMLNATRVTATVKRVLPDGKVILQYRTKDSIIAGLLRPLRGTVAKGRQTGKVGKKKMATIKTHGTTTITINPTELKGATLVRKRKEYQLK